MNIPRLFLGTVAMTDACAPNVRTTEQIFRFMYNVTCQFSHCWALERHSLSSDIARHVNTRICVSGWRTWKLEKTTCWSLCLGHDTEKPAKFCSWSSI